MEARKNAAKKAKASSSGGRGSAKLAVSKEIVGLNNQ